MDETFRGPVPIPAELLDDDAGDDADILTPERARAARTKAQAGFWFTLPRTGGKALVRRITSADRVFIGTLPSYQQQRVLTALAKVSDQKTPVRADGSISVPQYQRNAATSEEMVNAYCVAGFLKPRLIFTEAERTDPSEVLVTDLDAWDRQAYFLCSETNARTVADLFRAVADESPFDVPAGSVEPAEPATFGPVGDAAGRGKQRRTA